MASSGWQFLCQYSTSPVSGKDRDLSFEAQRMCLALVRCPYPCRAVPGAGWQHPTPALQRKFGGWQRTLLAWPRPEADFAPASHRKTQQKSLRLPAPDCSGLVTVRWDAIDKTPHALPNHTLLTPLDPVPVPGTREAQPLRLLKPQAASTEKLP